MAGTPRAAVDAIYRQFDSSNRQRELILAVADAVLDPRDTKRKRIGRLNAKTNDEVGYRNSLSHSDYGIALDGGAFDLAHGGIPTHTKASKFQGGQLGKGVRDYLTRITQLDKDLEALRNDMADVKLPAQTMTIPELLEALLLQEDARKNLTAHDQAASQDSEPPNPPSPV